MRKGIHKIVSMLLSITVLAAIFGGNVGSVSAATTGNKLLKIGITEDIGNLNPFVALSVSSCRVFQQTYDTLVYFDNKFNPASDLAKSWDLSSDKLTWTFHLYKGVKWHDGKPFTSADVKYTYETMQKSGQGLFSKELTGITDITTPDDYTVVIKTKQPKANMLYLTTPILPKHIWGGISIKKLTSFDNSKCIGTGPYTMVSYKKSDSCTLKANKSYFRGAPNFDGVVFKLFANTDNMAQSIKLGEINVAEGLSSTQAKSVTLKCKNAKLYKSDSNSFEDLGFNCNTSAKSKGNKAFLNVSIRKALEMALDKQKIINLAYNGDGRVGTTLIPYANTTWHYNAKSSEINPYNPEQAAKLLDAAGYSKLSKDGYRENSLGNVLNLRLFARSSSTDEVKAAEMIKSYLNKINVGATITTMDDDALTDKLVNSDYDLFIWNWSGDVDPSSILDVITTGEIGNLSDTYYSNKAYDEFYSKQLTQIDTKTRQKSVFGAQKIAIRDVPYSVLLNDITYEVIRTDMISNFEQINGNGSIFYADTNYNYLHASYGPDSSSSAASSSGSGPSKVVWIVLCAVIIIAVGAVVIVRKRKNPEDEE